MLIFIFSFLVSTVFGSELDRVADGRKAWEAWKIKNKNSYTFFETSQGWTGGQGIRITSVDNGKPVHVGSCEYGAGGELRREEVQSTKKSQTFENLLDKCANEIIPGAKAEGTKVELEFGKEGLLVKCQYWRDTCGDCGPRGYEVSIAAIENPPHDLPCPQVRIENFKSGSSVISEADKAGLLSMAKILKNFPALRIQVAGHTDLRGSIEKNLEIGEKRALATKSFLVSEGANPSQISVISYGKEKPQSREDSPQNRRVELLFVAE